MNPTQLTNLGRHSGSPRWSPNGERIAFDADVEGHFEIYVVSANGGKPQRLTNAPADGFIPRWSRDGRWVYFTSLRSGESQIWKVPSHGGEAVQVTRKGGFAALESPDGEFLYYTKTDLISDLWRAPLAGGEEVRILGSVKQRGFDLVEEGTITLRQTALIAHCFSSSVSQRKRP